MKHNTGYILVAAALALSACNNERVAQPDADAPPAEPEPATPQGVDQVELHVLDCGTIEVGDLGIFAHSGAYDGQRDTFTDSCWLVRHPDGDLVWDLGLPGMLAGAPPQENGVFTVSLERTLTDQLHARGIDPAGIEYMAVSHSHFDHIGQVNQVRDATWLVHKDEYELMFPPATSQAEGDTATQFAAFEGLERQVFEGEHDVFGDGSVIIFETPGHTPGHTSLQVNLDETGPVLLTGDLWHRSESRSGRHVPVFNADVEGAEDPGATTRASMDAFEARAQRLGATVIIQHEADQVDPLADVLR